MIEAILRTRCTVKVDKNFKVVGLGPADSLVEILGCALDERFITLYIPAPISYGDTNMIETVGWMSAR